MGKKKPVRGNQIKGKLARLKINYKRVFILSLIFSTIACLVIFDHHRVYRDFYNLKSFLQGIRYKALKNRQSFIVKFEQRRVGLYCIDGKFINEIKLPTLSQANYNTKLGDHMIVFSPGGTHEHNKRIHGGDIRLKSWLGFRKNIAINCNGFVAEGVYPEKGK